MRRHVEALLGRTLAEGELHSLPTLNDLPLDALGDVRHLAAQGDQSDAEAYLLLRLVREPHHRSRIPAFVHDVVAMDVDPATWGRKDLLVIAADPRSAADVRAALAALEGERWVCLEPDDPAEVERRRTEPFWAAPGVLVRDVPYHWRPPAGTLTLAVEGAGPLGRIADADLEAALRRWTALRAAP